MSANDQWFSPGDKVMRVATAVQLGLDPDDRSVLSATDFGKILCVSEFRERPRGNWIRFVGVNCSPTDWWFAQCFRKVEEVQLCVRAAKLFETPIEVGAPQTEEVPK